MYTHMYPKVTYHVHGDIIGSSCLLPYGHIWSVFDNRLQQDRWNLRSQYTIQCATLISEIVLTLTEGADNSTS